MSKIDLQVAKDVLEAQSMIARDPDLLEKIKDIKNIINIFHKTFKNINFFIDYQTQDKQKIFICMNKKIISFVILLHFIE